MNNVKSKLKGNLKQYSMLIALLVIIVFFNIVTAGRLLVIHDVTERVEAQKALKALNADLEQRVEHAEPAAGETVLEQVGERGQPHAAAFPA